MPLKPFKLPSRKVTRPLLAMLWALFISAACYASIAWSIGFQILSSDHWRFMADAYQNGHVFVGWRQYLALLAVPLLIVALYVMYAVFPMHIMLDRVIRREQFPGPGTPQKPINGSQIHPVMLASTTLETGDSTAVVDSQPGASDASSSTVSSAHASMNYANSKAPAKAAPAPWSIPVSRACAIDLGSAPAGAGAIKQETSLVVSVADLNALMETMSVEDRESVLAYERGGASSADVTVETIAGTIVTRHQPTLLKIPDSSLNSLSSSTMRAPPALPVTADPAQPDRLDNAPDDRIGAVAAGLTLVVDHSVELNDGGARCRVIMSHASVPMELGQPKWMICLILLVEDQRLSTISDLGQIIDVLAADAAKTIFDRLPSVDVINLSFVVVAEEQDSVASFQDDLPLSVHALADHPSALAEFLDLKYAPRQAISGPAFLSVLNAIKADIHNL